MTFLFDTIKRGISRYIFSTRVRKCARDNLRKTKFCVF